MSKAKALIEMLNENLEKDLNVIGQEKVKDLDGYELVDLEKAGNAAKLDNGWFLVNHQGLMFALVKGDKIHLLDNKVVKRLGLSKAVQNKLQGK